MFNVDGKTCTIVCRQGDTGLYVIEGLPTDEGMHNVKVFFSFYNSKRVIVGELSATPVGDQVTFFIPASITDKLTVSPGTSTATYFYGIKLCYNDDENNEYEDTLLLGDKNVDEVNKVIVYPKIVEGY